MLKLFSKKNNGSSRRVSTLKAKMLEKYQYVLANYDPKALSMEDIIEDICTYYEDIIGCMPGNVYWFNKDGIALGCNKNVLEMLGFTNLNQFKGLSFDEMGKIGKWTEHATCSFKNDTFDVLNTGKPKLNIEEPPLEMPNGKIIYFLTSRMPVFDLGGRVVGVVGISIDITDRKLMEQALVNAKKEADEANEIKAAFIENMQHDLRTPALGVCTALADMVKAEKDPSQKKMLQLIYKSSKQLLDLCRQVTDFDKMEHHEKVVVHKKFDLEKLLENIIDLNYTSANKKGLFLKLEKEIGVPKVVKSDNYRLKRILINLIGNAIKFTEEGGITLKVKVLQGIGKERVLQFQISDTGIGIPQDKQDFIYEKFTRGTPSNRGVYKGIGLGLRLVKKFIEDLSGDIEIDSKANEGTTFYISLPFEIPLSQELQVSSDFEEEADLLEIEEESEIAPIKSQIKSAQQLEHPDRLLTLLIEDDALARMAALNSLHTLNCAVTTADSVSEALKQLESALYDVVLSDIGLPDGTGFDIVRTIKSNQQSLNYKTPFFALTAHAGKEKQEEAEQAGFLALLTKPLASNRFQLLIEEHVRNVSSQAVDMNEENTVIDWSNLEKYGVNEDSLLELLTLLCRELPYDLQQIESARQKEDIEQLRALFHKLKGGLCYCAAPRFLQVTKDLHEAVKEPKSFSDTAPLFEKFYEEADKVMKEYKRMVS